MIMYSVVYDYTEYGSTYSLFVRAGSPQDVIEAVADWLGLVVAV